MDWLADFYLWTKALHIISVIAWMAGMLYLPRLFVYHADAAKGSELSETLKVMERRLLRAIINPAMIAAFVFGTMLLLTPGIVDWSAGWVYAKLLLVAGLTVLHHYYVQWRKDFERDENVRTARFYRIANEAPTLMMIGIVVLVVTKAF
ncbi:MAG: protoporphyrinogen oxidase HemJ [Alphaproteobacteria bacterium]